MKEEFLKSRYIHCDETRIQVIDEPDQKGSSQNWSFRQENYKFLNFATLLNVSRKNKKQKTLF